MRNKKIAFGSSFLEIVPLIFGGNVFGWTLDQPASFRILDEFTDSGFNAIDTANSYSHWVPGNVGGESETIIGNWLTAHGGRENLVLMTKVGGRLSSERIYNTKGTYIKEQVEHSLRRLKTDYIDLYQTHYDDEVTPIEETLRAYEDLLDEGKVRYIGVSNIKPERLVESLQIAKDQDLPNYISLQPEYNLYDRRHYELTLKPLVQEYDLAVIPYYSLASGFLSGKYFDESSFDQSARGQTIKDRYWNDRGHAVITGLTKVARKYDASASAVALAWLLAQDTVTAPIASATKSHHIGSFIQALLLQLEPEDLAYLDEVSRY